jgi:hypothetical protein
MHPLISNLNLNGAALKAISKNATGALPIFQPKRLKGILI